ncbi:MAG: TonB-dependent receptor [Gemmatimonadota bacterium]|nr:TonB-dependent receptor [Gemmatimonadota bacterium]
MISKFVARPLASYSLAVVASCALLATAASAQTGRITGKVTEGASGQPVQSVIVVARSPQGTAVAGATSGIDGSFAIERVPAGIYNVEAARIGYGKSTRTRIAVINGQATEVSIAMSPIPMQGEAVVVTGTRREERITDATASIGVVDGQVIEQKQEPTVFGALRQLKGVDFFETGLVQQQVSARGFVSPFTSNMLLLIDNRLSSLPGVGAPIPGLVLATKNDIRQVEVVLGPSSALYGANAGAGVVNIITKDPREYPGQSLEVTAGNQNILRIGVRSSGILSDLFGYKVSAETYTGKDFERYNFFPVRNPTTGAVIYTANDSSVVNNNVDIKTFGGSLYFYPVSGARVVYSGGFTRSNFINLSNIGRLQGDDWDLYYHQLRTNLDNFFGFGSLFLQGYYTGNSAGKTYNIDNAAQQQIPVIFGGPGKSRSDAIAAATFVDKSSRLDFEAQHTVGFLQQHFFTTGVQWRRSKPVSNGTYLSDSPGNPAISIDETGAYAQYENQMVPNLRLTLTGRYDHNSDFGNFFSPKAALSYGMGDQNVRVTYNRAFNAPPIQVEYAQSFIRRQSGLDIWLRGAHKGFEFVNLTPGGAVPAPIAAIKPAEITSLEAGYRGTWFDRLFVDVAAYQSNYKNFITSPLVINDAAHGIFVKDDNGAARREVTLTYFNYGELDITGVDVGAQLALNSMFSVSGAMSYQHPDSTFKNPRTGVAKPSFNAPQHKYHGAIDARDWFKVGTYAEAAYTHVSNFNFISAQAYSTGPVPAYDVVDLNAGIPLSFITSTNARLGIAVKNVFDKKHIEVPGSPILGRLIMGTFSIDYR